MEPDEFRHRIAELERQVQARTEEAGALRMQLEVFSTIDGETGMLNHNGLVDSVEVALHRLDRQREPFSVMFVKIPELKAAAQAEPGAAGEALRHASALLQVGLRASDRTARIADDVFAAVIAMTIEPDIPEIVERLRTLLTAAPITLESQSFDPHPRFSVVVVTPGEETDPNEILALAAEGIRRATENQAIVQFLHSD